MVEHCKRKARRSKRKTIARFITRFISQLLSTHSTHEKCLMFELTSSGFWVDFIEIYRAYPCLRNVESESYSERNIKNAEFELLIQKNPECQCLHIHF